MNSAISFTSRTELLQSFQRGESLNWDLIIVGGGITGAGVLREASRRGYRALLLEQQDFAWGTSSRSSKMVHGGLRYLASGDLRLTRHSLTERERMLHEAPGLVERMGYYFVLRKGRFPGRWAMSLVLKIYDHIAGIKDHRFVDKNDLQKEFPGLLNKNLKGACFYTDAVTDDARLVIRVLQEAIADGGCALNYTQVEQLVFENDQIAGVQLKTETDTQPITLKAPVVINATGAWADRLRGEVKKEKRVRPLRGSHLVIPRECLPLNNALTLQHPKDQRAVFVFPWEGTTVIGTTDLDHKKNLDIEASISEEEITYLLEIVQHQFPECGIKRKDIISSWSGVRPVIGSDKSVDASKERRDHAVWADKGLITVSGGKLTTFRLIALDTLEAASSKLPTPKPFTSDKVFNNYSKETNLQNKYHSKQLAARLGQNIDFMLENSSAEELKYIDGTSFSLAECRWSLQHEAIQHLDDLLLRRTRLGQIMPEGAKKLFSELKPLCMLLLGWNEQKWNEEQQRYQKIWQQYYSLPEPDSNVHRELSRNQNSEFNDA